MVFPVRVSYIARGPQNQFDLMVELMCRRNRGLRPTTPKETRDGVQCKINRVFFNTAVCALGGQVSSDGLLALESC
jgi:hypothetical protein